MSFGKGQTKFSLKSVQALRVIRDTVWIVASPAYFWLVKKGRLYLMWGNMFPCLRMETRIKENHSLTSQLWSSQVVRPRWKPEAGLKSPDVRLPGSLHLWPTSGHWRAFPAGTGNCAHHWVLSNCSLPSSFLFFFFNSSLLFFFFGLFTHEYRYFQSLVFLSCESCRHGTDAFIWRNQSLEIIGSLFSYPLEVLFHRWN